MTAVPDFATATFGLLDGWWNFVDARLPNAPLMDAPAWESLLRRTGFADVRLFGLGGSRVLEFRHTVVVAQASQSGARAAVTAWPTGQSNLQGRGTFDRPAKLVDAGGAS